jgi:hypothetical protein
MKMASVLALVLLAAPSAAKAGDVDETTPPPGLPVAQAPTEITIDRKTQFLGGLGLGGPLGAQATVGFLHGLGADVQEREDHSRVKAVCAFPISRCARGFLLEVGAGSGGGKASLGFGGHARVEDDGFHGAVEASLKLSVARTWGSPIGTNPNLTYLGPELGLSVMHVGLDVGVLWRVSGQGGSSAVFSWGLGLRL